MAPDYRRLTDLTSHTVALVQPIYIELTFLSYEPVNMDGIIGVASI